jgi:hypothetical protein
MVLEHHRDERHAHRAATARDDVQCTRRARDRVFVERRMAAARRMSISGGRRLSLGEFPRRWPAALARAVDEPFGHEGVGPALANR